MKLVKLKASEARIMRPKIFPIPSYIGSLKYLERVSLPLRRAYEVGFIIIQLEDEKRKDMVEYCREHRLSFFDLTESAGGAERVPFISPLLKRFRHSEECRKLLKRERPNKVVATKTVYPHDTILKEANDLGIETIILRWTFSADGIDRVQRPKPSHQKKKKRGGSSFLKKAYYSVLSALTFFLDAPRTESKYGITPAIPHKIGALNAKDAEFFSHSYKKETIRIIESIDIQSAFDLKQKIRSSEEYREKLLKKYNLDPRKIKIFLVAYRFYSKRDESDLGMTLREHLAYYQDAIKILRSFFPADAADIYLKLHPGEENVYDSYEELGVKIFGDESNIEELVCLADLYIASPQTNVNYLVLGSGVPALFINFSLRSHLEAYVQNFHIRHVITDKNDFLEKVREFKDGKLEHQYDNSRVDLKSLDRTVEFIVEERKT